jgi:hypothetical protein
MIRIGWPGLAYSVAALFVISAVPATLGWAKWAEVRQLRQVWTVAGEPCPVADATSAAALVAARRSFTYVGARYRYTRGMAYCADIPEPGPFAGRTVQVCQFNNPGLVVVETPSGASAFVTPTTQPMTITVRRGAASCVLAAWFHGASVDAGHERD